MAKIKNKKITKINQGLFNSIKDFIKKSLYYITKFLAKSSIIILFLVLTSLLTSLFYAINAKIDGSGIFGIVLAICFLVHILIGSIKNPPNTDSQFNKNEDLKSFEYYLNFLMSIAPIFSILKNIIISMKKSKQKTCDQETVTFNKPKKIKTNKSSKIKQNINKKVLKKEKSK